MTCLLIIPAFEPDEHLIQVVKMSLATAQDQSLSMHALIINDGSSPASAEIFNQLRNTDAVTVLELSENKGKGAALKLGFRYALEQGATNVSFVVTADADGQHLPEDIVQVALRAAKTNHTVLGVRTFDSSVPFRSRFGNLLTRQLFRLINGVDILDTQTGLRAIQRRDLEPISSIAYNRYEYEIEMLTALTQSGPVEQVAIATVYEPGNPSSHFNPVVDSARIYWVLLRYVLTLLFATVCEIVLIALLTALEATILATLVIARAVSVIIFFTIARSIVFKSSGSIARQAALYLLLVFVNLTFLYGFVWFAETQLDVPRLIAAVVGNSFFFSINFVVQRNFIFFDRAQPETKDIDP